MGANHLGYLAHDHPPLVALFDVCFFTDQHLFASLYELLLFAAHVIRDIILQYLVFF